MKRKYDLTVAIVVSLVLFLLFWFIPTENPKFGMQSQFEVFSYHLRAQRYSGSSFFDVAKVIAFSGSVASLIGLGIGCIYRKCMSKSGGNTST